MLKSIHIRNYAIIEHLELEFNSGLTVLTGETGAGKSILLGALGLVLGDRADSESIKSGQDSSEIVAEFATTNNKDATVWIQQNELEMDNECILRRKIAKDGRSKAYINGTPVNLQKIRELGELLIDIHGQHEHQSLMKPPVQRQLLDIYAEHSDKLEKVSSACFELTNLKSRLDILETENSEKTDKLDLLMFHKQELDALSLGEHEVKELNVKHSRLANVDQLSNNTNHVLQTLTDNEDYNASAILQQNINHLTKSSEIDGRLNSPVELLQTAQVNIEECILILREYIDSLDSDSGQLSAIEQRLQAIHDLSRKHKVPPEQLYSLHNDLSSQLNDLEHADEKLDELRDKYKELLGAYHKESTLLSKSRVKFAKQLGTNISKAMQTLGMSGGAFLINIASNEQALSQSGYDRVEFTVTTNAGQPCKPVAKVASGGELARIGLAIQMIAANQGQIPTFVFDEVDSGVGGGIAEIVGQQLHLLGKTHQVICVTHLPQVASQAHQHFKVYKQNERDHASTIVDALDKDQRVTEIARMLSGVEITKQSIAHAQDMITRSKSN